MRVLLAGCAGFIGYHLSVRLLEEEHDVLGVDNLSTGSPENVKDLRSRARFRFRKHDITKPLAVEGSFDLVCDLACPASPVDFGRRRLDILAACSQGVGNLLETARAAGAVFLHTSTSEVYGDPLVHPQSEDYWGHVNPVGERSCYDEGKRFAEALITAYRAAHGLETRTARVFNTYGPRMRTDDGRALPTFISQALAGEPLTIYGDGTQTRSFCYISDMVTGLLRLAAKDVHEPVNLGNPDEITMLALAGEVIQIAGSKSPIVNRPLPPDDPKVRRPDITRAQTELGWRPAVNRRDGLAKTIDWFRENSAGP